MGKLTIGRGARVASVHSWLACALACVVTAWPTKTTAQQRSDENAVKAAEDAFGVTIGRESLGLYTSTSVRGFSPTAAGNARIDGLYFDQVWTLNTRLRRSTTIRVGPSAQSFPFPAPTGIVDHALKRPGDEPSLGMVLAGNEWGGMSIEADAALPLVDQRLALGLGAAFIDEEYYNGTSGSYRNGGATLRWEHGPDFELLAFGARSEARDDEAGPIYVPGGDYLPPRVERRRFHGPDWADYESIAENRGFMARYQPSADWRLQAGVFRSQFDDRATFAHLLLDLQPDGIARRLIVADPRTGVAATSGELRATRALSEGTRRHLLHLTVRGRERQRHYGGSDTLDLGQTTIEAPVIAGRPSFEFGTQTRDRVTQQTAGAAYQLAWAQRGELGLGIQRTWYEKRFSVPNAEVIRSRDAPWLYNATAAYRFTSTVTAYASVARGLEETGLAPDIAANRGEALPAIHTRQADAGVRFRLGDARRLLMGVFEVKKPYFTLDAGNRFGALGDVTHRGLELSFTGALAPGVDVVLGGVAMRPRVSGPDVASGLVGSRAVGQPEITLLFNANWQPRRAPSFSFDIATKHTGRMPATRDNAVELPSRTLVDLGGRYRFRLGRAPVTARVSVTNITDEYGYELRGSGAYDLIAGRRVSAYLAADW